MCTCPRRPCARSLQQGPWSRSALPRRPEHLGSRGLHWAQRCLRALISLHSNPLRGGTFFFPFSRWETEALRIKVPCSLEVKLRIEGLWPLPRGMTGYTPVRVALVCQRGEVGKCTNSRSSPRLTSIESVMPSSHLKLCCPLLFQIGRAHV